MQRSSRSKFIGFGLALGAASGAATDPMGAWLAAGSGLVLTPGLSLSMRRPA